MTTKTMMCAMISSSRTRRERDLSITTACLALLLLSSLSAFLYRFSLAKSAALTCTSSGQGFTKQRWHVPSQPCLLVPQAVNSSCRATHPRLGSIIASCAGTVEPSHFACHITLLQQQPAGGRGAHAFRGVPPRRRPPLHGADPASCCWVLTWPPRCRQGWHPAAPLIPALQSLLLCPLPAHYI